VVRTDDDPAVLAHANAGVVYYFVLLYSDRRYAGGRRGLDIEQAAHAAARYVVRAVGANEAAIDAVLARQSPSTPAQV
jgi:hypothetical protein